MEVYGEKPKRFTPQWWDYIWYYYKWYFVSAVVGIFMVTSFLVQYANQTKYDLRITVVTENELVFSQADRLTEYAEGIVSDATENGKKEVYVSNVGLSGATAEYEQAQLAKLTVELSIPESYVYIMTRAVADMAIENGILEKSEVWAGDMESDGYVVSLKGNDKLKECVIDSDKEELYIGVARNFTENDEELEKKCYENGIALARDIVGLE